MSDPAGEPLIVPHEIVGLPSASTLVILRRELAGRPSASKTLIAFGDPVFELNDPRVHWSSGGPDLTTRPESSILERSAKDSGISRFERLPGTRKEVESIATLVASSTGRKTLDFDANRQAAMSPEIAQYRIIHIAAHGPLNNHTPDFSGLVLSLVDPKGSPVDRFLRAGDIHNLKLGADLVVLSPCQTAHGKEIHGEGLVGLTIGFMYAGAPRVVASLWRVPDQATAELMNRFYQGVLGKGMRPAAALQAAKAAVRNDRRWTAPYYWAGFVLQGEWR